MTRNFAAVAGGNRRSISALRTLRALAPNASGELDVLGHNGDTLGVDGAQVGVLEQRHEVSFGGLLQDTVTHEHRKQIEAAST